MINIKIDLPKVEFAKKKWLDKIATAQRREAVQRLKKLFDQTAYGWSEKPKMGWAQTKSADSITLYVYPTGAGADVWNLLNEGSPPHDIFPKRQGGMLRFQPGYRPATTPGQLQSRRKYRSGKHIRAPRVSHPGFKPRRFTDLIAQQYALQFGMDMQEAVTEAANM